MAIMGHKSWRARNNDNYGYEEKNNNRNREYSQHENRPRKEREEDPLARKLCDRYREHVQEFQAMSLSERIENIDNLFTVPGYPCSIDAIDESSTENLVVWQLDRRCRVNYRGDEPTHNRLSTTILLMNEDTAMPAYLITAFISPNGDASVTVLVYGEKGIEPAKRASWFSRGSEG